MHADTASSSQNTESVHELNPNCSHKSSLPHTSPHWYQEDIFKVLKDNVVILPGAFLLDK